ncbi:AIP3-domain-containing protein [Neoconidiobolus thromboides FSU 785]|nr:AIP3-domain-containing protein [Neoconidiobolus thromboides FSU 785]
MENNRDSSFNSDRPAMPRLTSSSNVALEKLKRRATTIRALSSIKLELGKEPNAEEKQQKQENISPLNSIRLANARNRMSSVTKMDFDPASLESLKNGEISDAATLENLNKKLVEATINEKESFEMDKELTSEKIVSFKKLFIKLDSKTKKIIYTGPLTIASLNMLFVENFHYHPGSDPFPALYIRDPFVNVFYELEDVNEVKDGSILQLNVTISSNDLKKEIDSQFSTMVMEIKDLRRLIARNNGENRKAANTLSMAIPNNNSRFNEIVKLAVAQSREAQASTSTISSSEVPAQVPQVDLKPINEEIKSLKNEISVIRQLSNEFQKESNDMIQEISKSTALFTEQLSNDSQSMQKILAAGKERMEQNALTLANKLEEIQINVDDFRSDLLQRRSQPSELRMKYTLKLLDEVNEMLLHESEFISEVKPTWKKAWEENLQNIVQEQQALKEQESIVEDMRADLTNLTETFNQLQEFIKLKRKASHSSRKSFEVAPIDENFSRDAVLQEIQCVNINSEKRLKALEQAIQARQWEIENQVDPFEEELTGFVTSAKLRKTGGTEELDRRRREQDEQNLKAMLAARQK